MIPALNEEEAIGSTIERTIAVRGPLREELSIEPVRIVVVSDRSTDGTVKIARGYEGIDLVVFETNRGYGAAIKAGWDHAPSDLLALIDADGTCDSTYFISLCRGLIEEGYDIVVGGRVGRSPRCPWYGVSATFSSRSYWATFRSGACATRQAGCECCDALPYHGCSPCPKGCTSPRP